MAEATQRLNAALDARYRIERRLGEGGMATVYLAEDLKHDRKVALKVLKPELAAVLGAERFVQEIKTTAALQHPHILPLFDSGEAAGFLYYVMPYIEGETLRERLDRERQLGVDEAVRIAGEIADALDYAHRNAVIHRDIKPENILLHDGRAMVADFGIALAVSAAAGGRMTETGLSLGTPHYMSPEQATAEKELTGRSDIYSLACVLYEMLAGDPPHTGSTAHQVIMKIVTDDPRPVVELRRTVPPHVADAIAIALEKLPADRFESAAAFAAALKGGAAAPLRAPVRAARGGVVVRRSRAGWIVGAAGLAIAALALLGDRLGAPSGEAAALRFDIALPDSAPLVFVGQGTLGGGRRALVLSPDGTVLVYAARERAGDRLYRRNLGEGFVATPIEGTEGAYGPVISPDGAWVAFFAGAELRKVPIGGGAPIPLARVPEPAGLAWPEGERILVAMREATTLAWVPASGGAPQELPGPPLIARANPSVLPGGRYALVELMPAFGVQRLGVTELETGETRVLTAAGPVAVNEVDRAATIVGRQPQYLDSGHLVYAASSGLVAVPFDPAAHEIRGSPVELIADVRRDWGAHWAVSAGGTLVYAPGSDGVVGAFAWASRDGTVDSLGFAPQTYGTFDLSPDGRRLAALIYLVTGDMELRIYDLEARTESRMLTRGPPLLPRWWPDGRQLVYAEMATRATEPSISIRQLVESTGARDTLGTGWMIEDIAPDTATAIGQGDVGFGGAWIFPLGAGGDPMPIDTFPSAWGPVYSPDGRWIAYVSNEPGQYEVLVVPTDGRNVRQKVSLDGGEEPIWSPRGDELIYRWGQDLYAVSVPGPGSTTFGRPRIVASGPFINVAWRSHDIAPDGRRHLVVLGRSEETTHRLRVITNWTDEVARRVGR